ncbi:unnamed protein product [Anisakis simplex]|uniref:Dihydropteridine reductase n=1 Tax=Anisakis simplex TaxID=6269 RepID=A0A0M3JYV5_ANISI|nr:unnamed protein product [Anisakis simplex]
MCSGRVIVYGGRGALGSSIIKYFKNKGYWIANIDMYENEEANMNVTVPKDLSWKQQEDHIIGSLKPVLSNQSIDALLCVAGGWAGGDVSNEALINSCDAMLQQSLYPSVISARLAHLFLKNNALLQFTGAKAALNGTPTMLGYGLAKASIHHLVKSLSVQQSPLHKMNICCVALLPDILDTPSNRKFIKNADFTTWTSLEYISELLHEWTVNQECRPKNGSLVVLNTKDGVTSTSLC